MSSKRTDGAFLAMQPRQALFFDDPCTSETAQQSALPLGAIILGVVIINALFGFIPATLKVSACDCE